LEIHLLKQFEKFVSINHHKDSNSKKGKANQLEKIKAKLLSGTFEVDMKFTEQTLNDKHWKKSERSH
jgi:hypothetical protein